MREAHLERLLARRPDGIFVSPFEQPDLFPQGLRVRPRGLGLETQRPPLSGRPLEGLDQGGKSLPLRLQPRQRFILMTPGRSVATVSTGTHPVTATLPREAQY
jgi:hypothetical protein